MTESIVAEAARLGVVPKPITILPKVPDMPEASVKTEPAARPPAAPFVAKLPAHNSKRLAILASAVFSLFAGVAGVRLMWPGKADDKVAMQPLVGDAKSTADSSVKPAADPPKQPETTGNTFPSPASSVPPTAGPMSIPIAPTASPPPIVGSPVLPAAIPTVPPVRFNFTEQTYSNLRRGNLPEDVVKRLESLKGRAVSQEELDRELSARLTTVEVTQYRFSIEAYAKEPEKRIGNPVTGPITIPSPEPLTPLKPQTPQGIVSIPGQTGDLYKPQVPSTPAITPSITPIGVPAPTVSAIPSVGRSADRYVVTEAAVEAMRRDIIPATVIDKLKTLKGKEYSTEAFRQELAKLLNPVETQYYETYILRDALQAVSNGSLSQLPSREEIVRVLNTPNLSTPPGISIPGVDPVQQPIRPISPGLTSALPAPASLSPDGFGPAGSRSGNSGSNGTVSPPTPSVVQTSGIQQPLGSPATPPGQTAASNPIGTIGVPTQPSPGSSIAGSPAVPAVPAVSPSAMTAPLPAIVPSAPAVSPSALTAPLPAIVPSAPIAPLAPGSSLALPKVDINPKPPLAPATPTGGGLPGTPSMGIPANNDIKQPLVITPPSVTSSSPPVAISPNTNLPAPSMQVEPQAPAPVVPTLPTAPASFSETARNGFSSTATLPRSAAGSTIKAASATERVPTTSFDVDLYDAKSGDSWESISQDYYGSRGFAAALRTVNQNRVTPGGTVEIPPIYILKQKYPTRAGGTNPISQPVPPPSPPPPGSTPTWGPSAATTPATASDGKTYRVPPGGANLRTIAQTVLGDGQKWAEIYNLNPWVRSDAMLPEGTELKVPANARLP